MNHEQLKAELKRGSYTCIAYDDNGLYYSSQQRGIAPLFALCQKNTAHKPLLLADKVIGKAAALLCIRCNVTTLYAGVVSKSALAVLADHSIDITYGKAVDFIANRDGTDKCPMEQLAKGVSLPDLMYQKVAAFLAKNT